MNLKKYNLSFVDSVQQWDEAIPLGCGKLGCLIYGDGQPLHFTLDRTDLWDNTPIKETQEKGFNYSNLIKLAKSNNSDDWAEHRRLFDDIYNKPTPTKITAGRIEVDFGASYKNIASVLDLSSAISTIKVGDINIESFCSAIKMIGAIKISGEYPKFTLRPPLYLSNPEIDDGETMGKVDLSNGLNYPAAEILKFDDITVMLQKTTSNFSYAIILRTIKQNSDTIIYYDIVSSDDYSGDFYIAGAKNLAQKTNLDYQFIKNEHIKWWKKFWSASSVNIPNFKIAKEYYISNYLLGSCSRDGYYPMPLQGVWTADNDRLPPWKGDYHHDLNTQMSYQSYMKANHIKEGKTFVDYLWNMRDVYKKYTKEFYGVDGLLIPGVSTLDGKPLGGWPQYSFSVSDTMWCAQSFDHYYLYTGSEQFLKQKAYPFFKDVACAIQSLLEEKNGKLYLPLSSSPEIHDNTKKSYFKPNTNNDLALLKYIFITLVSYCKKLNIAHDKYDVILSKLDDIALDENCVVKVNQEFGLEETHRHLGHLMCIYPLNLINFTTETEKKIILNTISKIEELGYGFWIGFSFAWFACICGKAHLGETCENMLELFCKGLISQNGFHLNGDYNRTGVTAYHNRAFTLESQFGFCDALQEMLLQNHNGYVELFASIPKSWRVDCSFTKLRIYGGILVSAKMTKGIINNICFYSPKAQAIKILNNFLFDFTQEHSNIKNIVKDGDFIIVNLKKGKNVLV